MDTSTPKFMQLARYVASMVLAGYQRVNRVKTPANADPIVSNVSQKAPRLWSQLGFVTLVCRLGAARRTPHGQWVAANLVIARS